MVTRSTASVMSSMSKNVMVRPSGLYVCGAAVVAHLTRVAHQEHMRAAMCEEEGGERREGKGGVCVFQSASNPRSHAQREGESGGR